MVCLYPSVCHTGLLPLGSIVRVLGRKLGIGHLVQAREQSFQVAHGLIQKPVGGEFVGIRHCSIFGSREPGVPREVVAMA